jgi:hypothetical protein
LCLSIYADALSRADLQHSLLRGLPTRFDINDIDRAAVVELLSSFERRCDQVLLTVLNFRLFRNVRTDLQNLLVDITRLAWVLNDAHARRIPKINGYVFHETLLLLGYRLVNISPLGIPRAESHLNNVVHLGLTAFIMTFFRGLDGKISGLPLLSGLARTAIQEDFDSERENQEVMLWLLFISRASIFKQTDDAWLIPKTAQTIQALGLHTWEDVSQTISKFPWVDVVHDKTGDWYEALQPSTLLPELL